MAYRNDLEALEARHAALEAEIAERTRERDDAARLLAEARERERAMQTEIVIDPARRRRQGIAISAGVLASIGIAIGIAYVAKQSRAEARFAAMYEQLERFTSESCACEDSACVEDVQNRMAQWGAQLSATTDEQPGAKNTKRFFDLVERMSACVDEVRMRTRVEVDAYAPYPTQAGGINGRSNDNDR